MDFLLIALLALGGVFPVPEPCAGTRRQRPSHRRPMRAINRPRARRPSSSSRSHSAPQATGFADSDVPFRLPRALT